jgi:hypothetical protein
MIYAPTNKVQRKWNKSEAIKRKFRGIASLQGTGKNLHGLLLCCCLGLEV